MKVEAHILSFNEEEMMGYTLRHYSTFCSKIVIHDGGSTDRTLEIARSFGAEIRSWDTGGKLNDLLAMELKNSCWLGTNANWVIVADCDELIYFPGGAEDTLTRYEAMGAAVIKPHGFDMYHPTFPTTKGQIYDEVKRGAPAEKWYAKPILFSPKRVAETGFGIGAHESAPVLSNGRQYHVDASWPKASPATYLLHFAHGIGTPERMAAKLDAKRARLSAVNEVQRWGNFEPGSKHIADKLAEIIPNLVQVVA